MYHICRAYLPEIILKVGKFMEIETSFSFLFVYLMRILFAFDFGRSEFECVCGECE